MGRVAVIHPDLGMGGAERLIVDASKALQDCGHQVTIYTGYHDHSRCFEETKRGPLTPVVLGKWIPRAIFGRLHALMAYLKMVYIALHLILFSNPHDLILCDQVSACIPFLKLKGRCKIAFYCHFPDQLLTGRESLVKAIYRKPLDMFEEWSTSLADVIMVNSKFTKNIVKRTFPSLRDRELQVLYPCVDVDGFVKRERSLKKRDDVCKEIAELSRTHFIYLSINRFERKKNLATAIEALSDCLFKLNHDKESLDLCAMNAKKDILLVIAGGYDPRLADSVAYRAELINLTRDLELQNHVRFIESPSDDEKIKLFQLCDAVVYTPEHEHFGIVPLEAMAMSKPVIASASGGPLETIEDGRNGLLCRRDDDGSWIEAMIKLYSNQKMSREMGKRGFERVKKNFSYESFRENLDKMCLRADGTS